MNNIYYCYSLLYDPRNVRTMHLKILNTNSKQCIIRPILKMLYCLPVKYLICYAILAWTYLRFNDMMHLDEHKFTIKTYGQWSCSYATPLE